MVEDLNQQQFIVASNYKQVTEHIAKGNQGPYGVIIRGIKSGSPPLTCNFSFERREVNIEAHKLAKFALSLLPGHHVWLDQPHDQVCIPHSVDFEQKKGLYPNKKLVFI